MYQFLLVKAVVGSSNISNLASKTNARAIATICFWLIDKLLTCSFISIWNQDAQALRSPFEGILLINEPLGIFNQPIKAMFSPTER